MNRHKLIKAAENVARRISMVISFYKADGKGEKAMKTIGLLGGMSCESTITYYKIINDMVNEKLGGLHSAKILLYSVDFQEIEECQSNGRWDMGADILAEAALNLEKAGADFILICTNTMHKVVPQIQKKISIPIVHIAEATAERLKESKIEKVALLGTKYTMKQDFYKEKLIREGIEVLIPNDENIEIVNHIIYDELCLGNINEKSRKELLRIIEELGAEGARGLILGCTELGLIVSQRDTALPLFDTALIHAEKAATLALGV